MTLEHREIRRSGHFLTNVVQSVTVVISLGTLSKPGRRRQRGHGKTKDLIGRTIAQHVRFKTLYIS